jgi:ABC-type transport system involved in Fe-S cluster assembly fused permease/ATPase subunit
VLQILIIALAVLVYLFGTWAQLHDPGPVGISLMVAVLLLHLGLQANASVEDRGAKGVPAFLWFLLYLVLHGMGLFLVILLLVVGAAGTFDALGLLAIVGCGLYFLLLWVIRRVAGTVRSWRTSESNFENHDNST